MYSERVSPQTVSGGCVINHKNSTRQNIKNIEYPNEDIFKDINEERHRILNFISKPCPHDFPKELKPLWKNNLEFSLTPYESGWMQIFAKKTHNPRKYTKYLGGKK